MSLGFFRFGWQKLTASFPIRTIQLGELPGCQPYTNVRVMRVRQTHEGLSLIQFLTRNHPPVPTENWFQWIDSGEITFAGQHVTRDQLVSAGQKFEHAMPGTVEPKVARSIEVLLDAPTLLVVNKPAPMPVHPSGRFNRNTLVELLKSHFSGERFRVVHRLDSNTTGVIVLCRSRESAASVQSQFENRTVKKRYIARVIGHPSWQSHTCELPIGKAAEVSDMSETKGARVTHPLGQPAQTNFEVIKRFANGESLVHAIPVTGRTNQIRVHLWSLGFPVLGDPLYQINGQLGTHQTLSVDDAPMCLHAESLTIRHPSDQRLITFECQAPF